MIKNITDIVINEKSYNEIINLYNYFGKIHKNVFTIEKLKTIINNISYNHKIFLYIDENDNIIAAITLIIEQKIIHNGGCVGHIEDFIVLEPYRKNGIGELLLSYVKNICERNNCYKIILNCTNIMENYYIKKGFNRKLSALSLYF